MKTAQGAEDPDTGVAGGPWGPEGCGRDSLEERVQGVASKDASNECWM